MGTSLIRWCLRAGTNPIFGDSASLAPRIAHEVKGRGLGRVRAIRSGTPATRLPKYTSPMQYIPRAIITDKLPSMDHL
jgi:hypothetical protein